MTDQHIFVSWLQEKHEYDYTEYVGGGEHTHRFKVVVERVVVNYSNDITEERLARADKLAEQYSAEGREGVCVFIATWEDRYNVKNWHLTSVWD